MAYSHDWQGRDHRELPTVGAALGRRHRPTDRRASRTRSTQGGVHVPWRSAPTARPCSPRARARRRGSGTPPPARPIGSPMKPSGLSLGRGVQPRRQDRAHRGLCRAGGVGRRHRPADRPSTSSNAKALLSAAFSPDGQRILIGGDEASARLWDATTGHQLGPPLPHHGRVSVDGDQPRRPDCG